jgi:hypothetical protein
VGTRDGELARTEDEGNKQLLTGIKQAEGKARAFGNKLYDAFHAHDNDTVPLQGVVDRVKAARKFIAGSRTRIAEFNSIMSRADIEAPDVSGEGRARDIMSEMAQTQFDSDKYSSLSPEEKERVNQWAAQIIEGKTPDFTITVRDLHGYYSELGRKLASGKLMGDVYQAVSHMRSDIGKMLEEQSPEFRDATNYWRRYKEVFKDATGAQGSASPTAKALLAKDPHYAGRPFVGESGQRGIDELREFSPEMADVAQRVRDANLERRGMEVKRRGGKAIIKEEAPGKPPKPTTRMPKPGDIDIKEQPRRKVVVPEYQKGGPQELLDYRREEVHKAIDKISQAGSWLLPVSGLKFIEAIGVANVRQAARVATYVPLYLASRGAIVDFLRQPHIVEFLAEPPAKDMAILNSLPPQYKTLAAQQMQRVAPVAAEQGLRIAPWIQAYIGANAVQAGRRQQDSDLGEYITRQQLLDRGRRFTQGAAK